MSLHLKLTGASQTGDAGTDDGDMHEVLCLNNRN
jgi:hypothetical protein